MCTLIAFSVSNSFESRTLAADFEKDVAPILIRRCLECHKGSEPSGGLSIETETQLLAGGDSGSAVQPGLPNRSHIIERIHAAEMPPPVKGVTQNLPDEEIEILQRWIAEGARWPKNLSLDLYEITSDVRGGRDWWAFQPVQRPPIPVQSGHPIDAFIAAKLKENGFKPAPPLGTEQLVRRLYFDTIGLPPSFEKGVQWSKKIAAQRSTGVAELIDHLLASPHFGERWARFWLDLVRYAETSGYERDQPKPFAWKYRDWVVNAINSDMPYNDFVRHQLAGDEISSRTESSLIATGFLRLGTWNDEPNDDAEYRYERLEDMVHATTSAFLGLTVKCARCHDHKFDPIPQDDYYKVASAFWAGPIAARNRKLLGGPSDEELGASNVLGWTDLNANPPPLHVLKNGEKDKPLHVVKPGTLTFAKRLSRLFDAPNDGAKTTGRRLQFADWIVTPENPLTASVYVNRLWQHHFGEGLVRSPNNFGFKGARPTHPALLDWLASELIDHNWSSKHIHRLILNSQTWQQSSLHPDAEEYRETDSANHWWWRANRRRLDAESLRDSMLAASGEIDLTIGGEGFRPTISSEALEGFSRKGAAWQAAPEEQQRRRSLYIFVSRSLMPPMMNSFDQCDTTLPCAQRNVTTVAPQALAMLNNHFSHSRSRAMATRIQAHADSHEKQITMAWRFALGRLPTGGESALSRQHLENQIGNFGRRKQQLIDDVSELPAPALHLRADDGVSLDGKQVGGWQSKEGRLAASQSSKTSRPSFVAKAINGQPALRFDGQGQFLRISGGIITNEHCTIIAVANDRAEKPGLREIISNWDRKNNVSTSVFLGLRDVNGVRFTDNYNAAGKILEREKPFVLTASNAADGARVWQNGAIIGSRQQPVTGRRFGTEWVIGQQGNIGGEFWHGDIAEVMVFPTPLSDQQLQVVWKSLHKKYGIARTSFDGSHSKEESSEHRALASLCHVLLNSNEFLYVD